MPETTCLGAAIAAGLAVGYYRNIQVRAESVYACECVCVCVCVCMGTCDAGTVPEWFR